MNNIMDFLKEDKSDMLIGVAISLIVFMTMAVAVRLLSRHLSGAGIWWDDWMALGALPLNIALQAIMILEGAHGLGKHIQAVPGGTAYFFRALYPELIFYHISVTLVKLSIFLFYRQVISARHFLAFLWIVAGVVLAWCIALTLVSIFQCQPVHKVWD